MDLWKLRAPISLLPFAASSHLRSRFALSEEKRMILHFVDAVVLECFVASSPWFFFFISFRLLWWHQQSMSRHRGVIHTSHMNMILFVISFRLTKCVQCFFFCISVIDSTPNRLDCPKVLICAGRNRCFYVPHTHTHTRALTQTYLQTTNGINWHKIEAKAEFFCENCKIKTKTKNKYERKEKRMENIVK